MSLDSLLQSRRSIRKYQKKPVPEAHVRAMVKSAMQQPSPANAQPVRYLKIASKKLRQALKNEMAQNYHHLLAKAGESQKPGKARTVINHYHRYSFFMFEAPLLFALGTIKKNNSLRKKLIRASIITPDNDRQVQDGDLTTGLSLAAFILKAEELGLATCVLTAPFIFLNPDSIPWDEVRVRCFVTAGFPDETPYPSAKKPLNEILLEL